VGSYETVIGLEVHAELLTESKIFCSSSAHFGGAPNTHVDPVTLGLPGALPVFNEKVLEMAIQAGLATNCRIARKTKFDRKHYFYADLPKGYQITQFDFPIAEAGEIRFLLNGTSKTVRLNRIHMEEDAGKLVHAGAAGMSGSTHSFADYNRAGVPLLEIVSEPDLRSSEEARIYLETLRAILMAIGVCDGKMEEGSLRCDANISLRPLGSDTFGTRVEIKNINSFRFLQKAIEYEVHRQGIALDNGETLVQETRLWDEAKNVTRSMRSKEDAHDYRYMPDPDLIWYHVSEAKIAEIQAGMPELPAARQSRYEALGISAEEASVLVNSNPLSQLFEASFALGSAPTEVSKWLTGDISAYLNQNEKQIEETQLSAAKLHELLQLMETGKISGKMAKTLLPELMEKDVNASTLVEQKGLVQISDTDTLLPIIDQVLADNPEQVEAFLAGKEKVLGFLMGQVMKATRGQADPGMANQMVRQRLQTMG
jgi:aspartyl-tRNA(Asn)/glutamyl-tRNA(Gln) amidotransferase subunit B